MKVLLRRNVSQLGKIGDVVEVKAGYARNYLLPQRLAVQPTEANLRAVEADKERYLAELAEQKAQLQARAEVVAGREVTLSARANEEGHLYGSIGPAQICQALAADGVFVDPENIVLEHPIRQLDKYDVTVRFAEGVEAVVGVWVVPVRDESGESADEEQPAAES